MTSNRPLSERPTIEPSWLFPLLDGILAFLVFAIAYVLRYELQVIRPILDPAQRDFLPYVPYAGVYAGLIWLNYQRNGLYRNIVGRSWLEEVYLIASGVAVSIVIVLAMFFILQPTATSRLMLIYVAALTLIIGSLSRLLRRWVLAYFRHHGIGVRRVLIVGMGDIGQDMLGTILARPDFGYRPVGFLDDDETKAEASVGRVEALGGTDQLEEVIRKQQVDTVIITFRWKHYDRIEELSEICRATGADLRIVPELMQLSIRQVQVENLDGIPLLGFGAQRPFTSADQVLKRGLDSGRCRAKFPLVGVDQPAGNDRAQTGGRRSDLVPSGARRQGRTKVRDAQIPQYGCQCRGSARRDARSLGRGPATSQVCRRSAHHPRRQAIAPHQPR